MLLGAAKWYTSGSVLIISENFDFLMPQRNNMRLNNIENGFELPESRTVLALKRSKHATDRVIVKLNLETAKSVVAGIAENKCSGAELRLNPVTGKSLDIKKPKTQLPQQRTRNRKRTAPARPRLASGMNLPGKQP